MIGDRDLLDSLSHPAKLGSHFGTELKSATLQSQLRKQRPSKDLVTSRLVVNAGAVKEVSEMRQQLCPNKKSKTALRAVRSDPIDHIGFSLPQRLQ
jgi:hypothetical protein